MRSLTARAVVAAAVLCASPASAQLLSPADPAPAVRAAAPVAEPAPAPPLTLVSRTSLGPRLEELEFSTPYLEGTTRVRVLRPLGYDANRTTRWPLLLLLHGCCDTTPFGVGGYKAWTDKGAAEPTTRAGKFFVVMPEAGGAGFYTDHVGVAGEGGPAWESYHIRQLLPWIDAHYRTQANRAHRAVAGLSMGGFGAMSYAARHPDLFSFAESYSGAVDPTTAIEGGPVRAVTATDALQVLDARPPMSAFGPWATEEVRVRAHSPIDMTGNLRQTVVTMRTGNGRSEEGFTTDPVEDSCHEQTVNLHRALAAAGVGHVFDDYGLGGHTWDKWTRGLQQLVGPLNAHFASGRGKSPTAFSFTTAEEYGDVYGYRFASDRGFLEFATFDVAPGRITLSGSGVFTLTTAPIYRSAARYLLTSTRNGMAARTVVTADGRGRISLSIDTARRSTGQQFRPGSRTELNQVTVAIRPI